ncbi:PKD domain-containing protein [Vibrio sp. T187]|uniref:PKD domain-containing protein n=1 Tax=Vibrio TaxID=662 RepID=UPI0010CA160B|nr:MULTISPECIES: PKD domain-containing protein [Vibrio]MBW3695041.1 PKD domain-containing protein [Vibrio sp. T187]
MNNNISWLTLITSISLLSGCNGESNQKVEAAAYTNQAPIAIAGINQHVKENTLVQLNGTSSIDKDSDLITYQWKIGSKPPESQASLTDSTSAMPTFMADAVGTYIIELVVNDGQIDSRTNQVKIVALAANENTPPVVDLGSDINANLVDRVVFHTKVQDADNDPLYYDWKVIQQPEGSQPEFTQNNSFVADVAGDYVIQLTVSDGLASSSDTVTVSYYYANVPPNAQLKPAIYVLEGMNAPLDASESQDPNGDSLTYQWQFVSKPSSSNAVITDPTAEITEFYVDKPGIYSVNLTVSDGEFSDEPYRPFYIKAIGLQAPHTKLFVGDDTEPQVLAYKEEFIVDKTSETGELPEHYVLGQYTIEAVGKDITISAITAKDYSEHIQPFFIGLSEGEIVTIKQGERATFELAAPPTGGHTTELSFYFAWSLNGYGDFSMQERFNASYQFTSR